VRLYKSSCLGSRHTNGTASLCCSSQLAAAEAGAVQVWSVCPIDSSSSLREENAIVCCSMLGGLTASKCLCDEVGHAEPDLLHFITSWQQVCSTETLTKVHMQCPPGLMQYPPGLMHCYLACSCCSHCCLVAAASMMLCWVLSKGELCKCGHHHPYRGSGCTCGGLQNHKNMVIT